MTLNVLLLSFYFLWYNIPMTKEKMIKAYPAKIKSGKAQPGDLIKKFGLAI